MSLYFPSKIGEQFPASYEAEENLSKLLQVDLRGGKDQVATRVALEHFQRKRDLCPGYFDGLKSWAKSGVVYGAAGTATLGVIGLSVYGIWQIASKTDYGLHLAAGLCGTAWISSECGYRPVDYLKAFLAVTVRDSANRAAKSSVKNDERTWNIKEAEAKECHKQIVDQLSAVFDDCAKELNQRLESTQTSETIDSRLELKQLVDRLEKQVSVIEKLLAQFDLGKHEVEKILQRFKDRIRFVHNQACSLSKKSSGKMNSELLAGWPIDAIREIAVPFAVKERVSVANKCRFGMITRAAGYGSVLLSGAKTFAISTAVVIATTAAWHAYQNGIGATMYKPQEFFKTQNWSWSSINQPSMAAVGAGTLVVGPTIAVVAKKGLDFHRVSSANAEYIESERNACATDLEIIYQGVAMHLKSLRYPQYTSLATALRERLPAIRKEIKKLGIVDDPSNILGSLEQAVGCSTVSSGCEETRPFTVEMNGQLARDPVL